MGTVEKTNSTAARMKTKKRFVQPYANTKAARQSHNKLKVPKMHHATRADGVLQPKYISAAMVQENNGLCCAERVPVSKRWLAF